MKTIIFTLLVGASLAFPAGASHATFPDNESMTALKPHMIVAE